MADISTVLLVTVLAGSATGLGALPIFFRSRFSHRTYDSALGLAAGIMIAASVFGLILPGLEDGTLRDVIIGLFLGGMALLIGNRLIPHLHTYYLGLFGEGPHPERSEDDISRLRKAVLIGGAITLHNAPEGLAMGVAFASGLEEVAFFLAIIIGIQNVPDGFAFAVPIGETGLSSWYVLIFTTLSGLVPQVLSAMFGFALVSIAMGIFPMAAGFAAGAMIAVVFREMVPMSHGHGYADAATTAFLIGFVILLIVEEFLG